ncbi:mucin-5AC-like [Hyperolius riggenbachi]|uniref:mucin-5AC-like n=1 Tax=Hyperolius riggenbachi TaxID=752182 RepID=UPI0035A3C76B
MSLKLNEMLIEVKDHVLKINGKRVILPYNDNGVRIDNTNTTLKISIKLMLDITWEDGNSIHLTLNKKYMGETCGLCGNYNGRADDDITFGGMEVDPLIFGQLYALRKPEETCQDPKPDIGKKCNIYRAKCLKLLKSSKWARCNRLVKPHLYVEAYMMDMCLCKSNEKLSTFCLCTTIAEYSRQCALAGGKPPEWRSPTMCYIPCPANLIYSECSPPCAPTCSNPGTHYLCDGPCVAGCVCPKDYVLDDITHSGCVPMENCSCVNNNVIYPSGSAYTTPCSTCKCSGGHWTCEDIPCPSICSVEGGSHITTFDKMQYTFHGKCMYVLAKPCANNSFVVTAEMKKCAFSEAATCLSRVFLILDNTSYVFEIKFDNNDFPHVTFDKESMAKAGVSIFWPSSFFLIVYTNKGLYLEVQLTPVMQLYIILDPTYKEKMCGLCGNFNSIQKDDFQTSSGVLESNAVDFANTWKTQYQCENVPPIHEHPCMYGIETEKYAHYWCQVLLETEGPFGVCHAIVNPGDYYQTCLFDTCSCKRAEDCLCASLSSYAWACAAAGVVICGWRENICRNFLKHCPPSFVYSYNVTTCIPTCRSLSEPDRNCNLTFYTVDGCVCPQGTYLDDRGVCVLEPDCPCYYKGFPVAVNELLHVGRLICICTNGTLKCNPVDIPDCPPPMTYFDCDQAGENAKGAQCPQTCDISKAQCYSPLCVSGCVCPKGLLLSENGTCITEDRCPCVHNGLYYSSGENATINCENCVCQNRTWICDSKPEKAICTLYGEGHFITFDNKHYTTNGNCEYTLVQDYCDAKDLENGTFKIITENIPCGTTGTSCSVAIVVFLGAHKLILADGRIDVMDTSSHEEIPYLTRKMGLYLVIETKIGLVIVWDRRTSIFIHLSIAYKGKVCGLCGNFDGNSNNDFTTRAGCSVKDVKIFRDSWKSFSDCPEIYISKEPCAIHPYRMAWAQKMCSIVISDVFSGCHAEVDPERYYDACVRDTCACDTGGDCACYCTAVAAYAQACSEACVCIEWRTPTVCPMFCDIYNNDDNCEWHYKACGAPCLKTCRNPNGTCYSDLKGLEGCYPICSKERPYFDEDVMQCVAQCGCLDNEGNYYNLGEEVESCNICEKCFCTENGIQCHPDSNACNCEYEGIILKLGEVIRLEEGPQGCRIVKCTINGTEETLCSTTPGTSSPATPTTLTPTATTQTTTETTVTSLTPTTPTTFKPTTTTPSTTETTVTSLTPSTSCVPICEWSQWFDVSYPIAEPDGGDFETFENIRNEGFEICDKPDLISCRAQTFPNSPLEELSQKVTCNVSTGLVKLHFLNLRKRVIQDISC